MELTEDQKAELIARLRDELVVLRAKSRLSQDEISNIVGLSRQSYSAFELKKKDMSWRTCFSLLMYFNHNPQTHNLLRALRLFPKEFGESINI